MAAQVPRCPTRTRYRSHRHRHGPQPQPTCRRSTGARPRVTRARMGAGRGVARGRRRSEEGRCSGAGRGPTGAPFIIAAVDSPEVEKATDGRRAPRSLIEGEGAAVANRGRRASCSTAGSPAPCRRTGGGRRDPRAPPEQGTGMEGRSCAEETEVRLLPCGGAHSLDPPAADRICGGADRIKMRRCFGQSRHGGAWRSRPPPQLLQLASGSRSSSAAATPPAGVGRGRAEERESRGRQGRERGGVEGRGRERAGRKWARLWQRLVCGEGEIPQECATQEDSLHFAGGDAAAARAATVQYSC
jgi:hypothetical protein